MARPARLPPLNGLRAFEAAGRHLSFTQAAEELGVTVSAVSHQIRQLEAYFGTSLFHRTGRGLELSAEGALLLPGLRTGFDQLARAVSRFEERHASGLLSVSMLSTFAMRWFIPRLPRFQEAHPDIEVRIATSVRVVDLEREAIDCAIRYGAGSWPGLHATRLFAERLVPVCHPRLLGGEWPLRTPADLRHRRLLHAQLRPDDWRMWLHAAGVHDIDPSAGTVLETRNFVISAAVEGLGVAILDPKLITDELASGRLVQPFAGSVSPEGAYYLVCPEARAHLWRIEAFRSWLLSETASDRNPDDR